jgi:hypothetical protein
MRLTCAAKTVVHIERNNYCPSQMIAVNPRMPNARRQVQPRVRLQPCKPVVVDVLSRVLWFVMIAERQGCQYNLEESRPSGLDTRCLEDKVCQHTRLGEKADQNDRTAQQRLTEKFGLMTRRAVANQHCQRALSTALKDIYLCRKWLWNLHAPHNRVHSWSSLPMAKRFHGLNIHHPSRERRLEYRCDLRPLVSPDGCHLTDCGSPAPRRRSCILKETTTALRK